MSVSRQSITHIKTLRNLRRGVSTRGSFARTSGIFCRDASLFRSLVEADFLCILSGLVARVTFLSILVSYSLSVTLLSSYLRSSAVRLEGRGLPDALLLCDVPWAN